MAKTVQIPADAIDDLKLISSIEPEKATAGLEELDKRQLLTLAETRKALASVIEAPKAAALVRQLIGFRLLVDHGQFTGANEAFEAVSNAVATAPDLAAQAGSWKVLSPILSKYLHNRVISSLAKAIDLNMSRTNMLTETRILTDIRPVFLGDSEASLSIDGSIIIHTLSLIYLRDGQTTQVDFAMSIRDVEQLLSQCKRALAKSQAVRSVLRDSKLPLLDDEECSEGE